MMLWGRLTTQGERFGSGDGEGWTLLTRQMLYEPLPASVLLGDVGLGLEVADSGGIHCVDFTVRMAELDNHMGAVFN